MFKNKGMRLSLSRKKLSDHWHFQKKNQFSSSLSSIKSSDRRESNHESPQLFFSYLSSYSFWKRQLLSFLLTLLKSRRLLFLPQRKILYFKHFIRWHREIGIPQSSLKILHGTFNWNKRNKQTACAHFIFIKKYFSLYWFTFVKTRTPWRRKNRA